MRTWCIPLFFFATSASVESSNWTCYYEDCAGDPCVLAVSLSESDQVQCLSSNGLDCDFTCCKGGDVSNCHAEYAVPLECGSAHASLYNGTGYLIDHWCNNACIELFEGRPDENNCNPYFTNSTDSNATDAFGFDDFHIPLLPFIDIACWLPEKAGNTTCQVPVNETGVPLKYGSYLSQLVVPDIGFSLFFDIPFYSNILTQINNNTEKRHHRGLSSSDEAARREEYCQEPGRFGTVLVDKCENGKTTVHLYSSSDLNLEYELDKNIQDCFNECLVEKMSDLKHTTIPPLIGYPIYDDLDCVASLGNHESSNTFSCVTFAPLVPNAWLWDDGPSSPWFLHGTKGVLTGVGAGPYLKLLGVDVQKSVFENAMKVLLLTFPSGKLITFSTYAILSIDQYLTRRQNLDAAGVSSYNTLFYGAWVWHDWCYHHNPITYGKTQAECDEISFRITNEICRHFGTTASAFFDVEDCLSVSVEFYLGVSLFGVESFAAANTLVEYGRPLEYISNMNECKTLHINCVKCARYNSAHPDRVDPDKGMDFLQGNLFCMECETGYFAQKGTCTETPFGSEFFPPKSPGPDFSTKVVCRQVSWDQSIGGPSPRCLYSKPCSMFPMSSDLNYPIDSVAYCQHIGYELYSSQDSTCPEKDNYCWVKVYVPHSPHSVVGDVTDDGFRQFWQSWMPSGIKLEDESCFTNGGIGTFINYCGSDGDTVFDVTSVNSWIDAPKGDTEECLAIDADIFGLLSSSKNGCMETPLMPRGPFHKPTQPGSAPTRLVPPVLPPPRPWPHLDIESSIVCRQVGWDSSIGNPNPRCLYSQPCSNFPLTINDPIDSINFCQHVGYYMNSSRDSTCPESDSYCWINIFVPYDDGIGGLFLNAWTPSGVSLGDGSCVQNDGISPSGKSFINMCGNDHNNAFEPSISVGAWLAAPKGNSQVCLDMVYDDKIEYGFKSSKETCVEALVLGSDTSATNFDTDDEAECKTITTLMYTDFQPTPVEVTSACRTLWLPDSVPTKDDDVFIGGEIKCRKYSYEVQGKWVSPRPEVCGDVETAAAALDLKLTPGCSLWFWCMQEASQWIIGSDQVYVL